MLHQIASYCNHNAFVRTNCFGDKLLSLIVQWSKNGIVDVKKNINMFLIVCAVFICSSMFCPFLCSLCSEASLFERDFSIFP